MPHPILWLGLLVAYGSAIAASHCPQPLGTNLVVNPGFESGKLYPWKTGSDKSDYAIVSPGHNSKYAAQYTFHSTLILSQNVSTCSNTLYKYSLDFQVQQAKPSTIAFDFNFGNAYRTVENTASTGWRRLHGLFIHPYPSPYYPTVYLGGYMIHDKPIKYVNFDNIEVEALSTAPLTPVLHAKELLRNNGFETGHFAPWQYSGHPTIPRVASPGINSTYALHFTGEYFGISQNISVVAGTPYLFGMQYDTQTPFMCSISQYGFNSQDSEAYEIMIESPGTGSTRVPFLGLKNGTVGLYMDCSFQINGTVVLDNLIVKELEL